MRKAIFIAVLIIQANAMSFYDIFAPVEDSLGTLVTNVVTDIRETIDCTIYAVEHVFSFGGMFGGNSDYKQKCWGSSAYSEQNTDDTSADGDTNDTDDTPDEKPPDKVKEAITQHVEDSASKASKQIQNILAQSNAHQKIQDDEDSIKNEVEHLAEVSALLRREIDKLPYEIRNKFKFDFENPTKESVLDEVKMLYGVEQQDQGSAVANEVRHIFEEVLKIFNAYDIDVRLSDEDQVKLILKHLGKSSQESLTEMSQWIGNQKLILQNKESVAKFNYDITPTERENATETGTKQDNVFSLVPSAFLEKRANATFVSTNNLTIITACTKVSSVLQTNGNSKDTPKSNQTLLQTITQNLSFKGPIYVKRPLNQSIKPAKNDSLTNNSTEETEQNLISTSTPKYLLNDLTMLSSIDDFLISTVKTEQSITSTSTPKSTDYSLDSTMKTENSSFSSTTPMLGIHESNNNSYSSTVETEQSLSSTTTTKSSFDELTMLAFTDHSHNSSIKTEQGLFSTTTTKSTLRESTQSQEQASELPANITQQPIEITATCTTPYEMSLQNPKDEELVHLEQISSDTGHLDLETIPKPTAINLQMNKMSFQLTNPKSSIAELKECGSPIKNSYITETSSQSNYIYKIITKKPPLEIPSVPPPTVTRDTTETYKLLQSNTQPLTTKSSYQLPDVRTRSSANSTPLQTSTQTFPVNFQKVVTVTQSSQPNEQLKSVDQDSPEAIESAKSSISPSQKSQSKEQQSRSSLKKMVQNEEDDYDDYSDSAESESNENYGKFDRSLINKLFGRQSKAERQAAEKSAANIIEQSQKASAALDNFYKNNPDIATAPSVFDDPSFFS